MTTNSPDYDVVVVGGGAAGLSGALTLTRARRTVLVLDSGHPRNAPAAGVHAFLTRDGTPPAELLAAGRDEVRRYGGRIDTAEVVDLAAEADGGFRLTTGDGAGITARRVLLATGLVDELPNIPGLAEHWGGDVVHCPYCHGWEVRDQAIGVLATGPLAVHQALLWRQWSDDVALFGNDAVEPTDEDREQLAARGVSVVDGPVAAVESVAGRVTGVRLADGTVIPRETIAVASRMTARTDLLRRFGIEPTPLEVNGHNVGSYVAADPSGATAVPGIWVAGNVNGLVQQVIGAADAGTRAGAMINADLVTEDAVTAAARRRERAALSR